MCDPFERHDVRVQGEHDLDLTVTRQPRSGPASQRQRTLPPRSPGRTTGFA